MGSANRCRRLLAVAALCVTAGLNDPRVSYHEPAKWVAKLRTLRTNESRLLLHTNMEAGHGGASGRFQQLREVALQYAFLLDLADRRATVPAETAG